MNRQHDVDEQLRGWLDEGPEVMPDRYMWAALERIETTRQRGAMWRPLEDLFMRIHPIAAVVGVAAVMLAGVAAYLALSGGPGIGETEASPSPSASSFRSSEFAVPISINPPEGWVTYEAREGVVTGAPPGDGVRIGERVVIFRTTGAEILSGLAEGHVPWPDDLAAWLADNPEPTEEEGLGSIDVTVTGVSERTVGGAAASVIEATSSFNAPSGVEASADLIAIGAEADGLDVQVRPGEMSWRFVTIPDRELGIAYGATPDEFSEDRFEAVLSSLSFVDE